MEMLELNPKELVYLASVLGATEFFGLKDPFYGMSRSEITTAISNVQMQLNERGIIEMDFTGRISVAGKVKNLVYDCAFCDAYALGEYQQEQATEQFTVYCKGNNMILLRMSEEKVQLNICDVADILRLLSSLVKKNFSENTHIQVERCNFSYDVVYAARKIVLKKKVDEARDMLLSAGLNRVISEVFLNSFFAGSCRGAFVITDFRRNVVYSVLCVADSTHMICIERDQESEQEQEWIAFETTYEGYLDEVKKILNKVRCSVC